MHEIRIPLCPSGAFTPCRSAFWKPHMVRLTALFVVCFLAVGCSGTARTAPATASVPAMDATSQMVGKWGTEDEVALIVSLEMDKSCFLHRKTTHGGWTLAMPLLTANQLRLFKRTSCTTASHTHSTASLVILPCV